MSDYPWSIQDKINDAIRGLATSHEVSALRSNVDSLECSMREARSEADGLRAELSELRQSVSVIQDALISLQELALSTSRSDNP